MMLRWMEYDPIAVTVLIVGMGAVSLLALGPPSLACPQLACQRLRGAFQVPAKWLPSGGVQPSNL
jgi:hypothetical protein